MTQGKTLVIGAAGQIGIELVIELRKREGKEQIVAADIRPAPNSLAEDGPFEILNILNDAELRRIVEKHGITRIYHLAAMLSATGEKDPMRAWDLNMNGLFNVLNLAKEGTIDRIFWPSSIAVFGPTTPKDQTPQDALCEPTTVYGISKLSGERWCAYYHEKYGVDVRGLRYPGLIGHRSAPGGGTTDYAVDIFHKAVNGEPFTCFLKSDMRLPMMYMEDAIRATIEITEADPDKIKIHHAYNLAGLDFTPTELHEAIQRRIPDFKMEVDPDFRQQIAEGWPSSINDQEARSDWGWKPQYDLDMLVDTMLDALSKKKSESETLSA